MSDGTDQARQAGPAAAVEPLVADRAATPRGPRLLVGPAVFTAALVLGSGLLFAVQPMFTRFALPLVGGSPAVWTVAVMFFQAALLAGYAYADWSVRRLGPRRQAMVHCGLLLVPLVALPIGIPAGWAPPVDAHPAWWLLGVLAWGVGLPFVALATGAPLLQRWFAELPHRRAADPYFLYRASNAGSFLGLLAYPLLIEPAWPLRSQARLWTAGYLLWSVLVVVCAAGVLRARREVPEEPAAAAHHGEAVAGSVQAGPSGRDSLRWIVLAMVPSSLLLGVTTTLTVDIAPMPLLWVVPLGIYLLTFVVAFSAGTAARAARRAAAWSYPLLALPALALLLLDATRPLWLIGLIYLAAFTAGAMLCHGRLAELRPHPHALTRYYLCIALGGALGGVLNGLLAPELLPSVLEFPIALLATFWLLPRRGPAPAGPLRWVGPALPALTGGVLAVAALTGGWFSDDGAAVSMVTFLGGCALVACMALMRRPAIAGLAAVAVFGAVTIAGCATSDVLLRDRNFYGALEVRDSAPDGHRMLLHGTTLHGAQALTGDVLQPTTYYSRAGPLGDVVTALRRSGRTADAAVVGLGVGTAACHAQPGETWTFYEINPMVVRLARDPALFTFLRDCPGRHPIVLGDARLSLAASPNRYGLIVLDAFSSDAIPTHLLTRQAVDLYLSRLRAGGAIAVHVSNRYGDLEPVLGRLAADAGLRCLDRVDSVRADREGTGSDGAGPDGARAADDGPGLARSASHWVVLARSATDLGGLAGVPGWESCRASASVWTDDHTGLIEVVSLR